MIAKNTSSASSHPGRPDGQPPPADTSGASRELSVLIVEDTRAIARFLQSFLRKLGFRAEVAEDGYEGWQRIRQNTPDLIITDIDMPVWNGFELMRAVRGCEDEKVASVPILVCTSEVDPAVVRRARRLGATACFFKPVDFSRLKAFMRDHRLNCSGAAAKLSFARAILLDPPRATS